MHASVLRDGVLFVESSGSCVPRWRVAAGDDSRSRMRMHFDDMLWSVPLIQSNVMSKALVSNARVEELLIELRS